MVILLLTMSSTIVITSASESKGKDDLLEAAKPIVCQVQALHCCVGLKSVAKDLNPVARQIQLCQACQMAYSCYETDLIVSKPEDLHK